MKPKIPLPVHDVEFQQQERAKSDQIKKQLLIFQEKVPSIIKFKPQTFVFSPPKDIVFAKNNHLTSSSSNLGFPSFLPKTNLFDLSKTNPTCLEKEDFFTLPFLSSSLAFTIVVVPFDAFATTVATVGTITVDDAAVADTVEAVTVAFFATSTPIDDIAVEAEVVDSEVAVTAIVACYCSYCRQSWPSSLVDHCLTLTSFDTAHFIESIRSARFVEESAITREKRRVAVRVEVINDLRVGVCVYKDPRASLVASERCLLSSIVAISRLDFSSSIFIVVRPFTVRGE